MVAVAPLAILFEEALKSDVSHIGIWVILADPFSDGLQAIDVILEVPRNPAVMEDIFGNIVEHEALIILRPGRSIKMV